MKHRDLLDAVRYETAIELMQNPGNTVTDIAALPGYTESFAFRARLSAPGGG